MTVFAHSQTAVVETLCFIATLFFFFVKCLNKSLSEYNSLGHCQTGHEVVSLLEMKEVTGCKLYNNNNNNNNNNYIAHFL